MADGCTGLASAIKTLLASEILRPDVAERRRVWIETRQPDMANMLEKLIFIDETSLKTNRVKTTGWAPVGKRLIDHASFGHSLPGNGLPANRERGIPRPSSRALAVTA